MEISYELKQIIIGFGLAFTAAILLVPLIRPLLWWAFSFDKQVAAILSQKKSSEVLTGKIVEEISPLLPDFPVDLEKEGSALCFMGQPIDYVYFDDEGITFIEVKSGNSKLSQRQRVIREHIQQGRVSFVVYRRN